MMPSTEIRDIILMILFFLGENKYLNAMKKAVVFVLLTIYDFNRFSIFSR